MELKPFYDGNVPIEKNTRFIYNVCNAIVAPESPIAEQKEAKQFLAQFAIETQTAPTLFVHKSEREGASINQDADNQFKYD